MGNCNSGNGVKRKPNVERSTGRFSNAPTNFGTIYQASAHNLGIIEKALLKRQMPHRMSFADCQSLLGRSVITSEQFFKVCNMSEYATPEGISLVLEYAHKAADSGSICVWECQSDNGWQPYKPDEKKWLELNYRKGSSCLLKRKGGFRYQIDLQSRPMTQTNVDTHTSREVRRRCILWECRASVTRRWTPFDVEIAVALEKAYQAFLSGTSLRKVEIRAYGHDSTIDLKNLTITNKIQRTEAPLRRVEVDMSRNVKASTKVIDGSWEVLLDRGWIPFEDPSICSLLEANYQTHAPTNYSVRGTQYEVNWDKYVQINPSGGERYLRRGTLAAELATVPVEAVLQPPVRNIRRQESYGRALKAVTDLPTSPEGSQGRWSCNVGTASNPDWKPYDSKISKRIEEAYTNKRPIFFSLNRVQYTIDFKLNVQKSVPGQFGGQIRMRDVRRVAASEKRILSAGSASGMVGASAVAIAGAAAGLFDIDVAGAGTAFTFTRNATGNLVDGAGNLVDEALASHVAKNATGFAVDAAGTLLDKAGNVLSGAEGLARFGAGFARDSAGKVLDSAGNLVSDALASNVARNAANYATDGAGNLIDGAGTVVGAANRIVSELLTLSIIRNVAKITTNATGDLIDGAGKTLNEGNAVVNEAMQSNVAQSTGAFVIDHAGNLVDGAGNIVADAPGFCREAYNFGGDVVANIPIEKVLTKIDIPDLPVGAVWDTARQALSKMPVRAVDAVGKAANITLNMANATVNNEATANAARVATRVAQATVDHLIATAPEVMNAIKAAGSSLVKAVDDDVLMNVGKVAGGLVKLSSQIPVFGVLASCIGELFQAAKTAYYNKIAAQQLKSRVEELALVLTDMLRALKPPISASLEAEITRLQPLLETATQYMIKFGKKWYINRLLSGDTHAEKLRLLDKEMTDVVQAIGVSLQTKSIDLAQQMYQQLDEVSAMLVRSTKDKTVDLKPGDPVLKDLCQKMGLEISVVTDALSSKLNVIQEKVESSAKNLDEKLDRLFDFMQEQKATHGKESTESTHLYPPADPTGTWDTFFGTEKKVPVAEFVPMFEEEFLPKPHGTAPSDIPMLDDAERTVLVSIIDAYPLDGFVSFTEWKRFCSTVARSKLTMVGFIQSLTDHNDDDHDQHDASLSDNTMDMASSSSASSGTVDKAETETDDRNSDSHKGASASEGSKKETQKVDQTAAADKAPPPPP